MNRSGNPSLLMRTSAPPALALEVLHDGRAEPAFDGVLFYGDDGSAAHVVERFHVERFHAARIGDAYGKPD